jgi:predicted nicotinamide N-methyase
MNTRHAAFIRDHAQPARPPLVPEVELLLAAEVTPLWEATEVLNDERNIPPPYWGFAWPGGQAVARLLFERPELAAGRRVLDFAAGSGLIAIAAAKLGASVRAVDIDPLAVAAMRLNAGLNGVAIEADDADLVGDPLDGFDAVFAGDICYERPMAERALAWLRPLAARGYLVLLGDPGRAYLPKTGLEKLATYAVPTSLDLEDRTERITNVWRVLPE